MNQFSKYTYSYFSKALKFYLKMWIPCEYPKVTQQLVGKIVDAISNT